MARRWIPRVCATIFVGGIAGIIVASVNGNNAGVILCIGLVIVLAAVALLTLSAAHLQHWRIDAFDEAAAEQLEAQVMALVAAGAPEEQVRALVRDAMRVGHR
jgi:Flp pilus assembly protein TadB